MQRFFAKLSPQVGIKLRRRMKYQMVVSKEKEERRARKGQFARKIWLIRHGQRHQQLHGERLTNLGTFANNLIILFYFSYRIS